MRENCRRCGGFLEKYESLLCARCYEEFSEWSKKRFTHLARKNENPLELWLKEVEKHD